MTSSPDIIKKITEQVEDKTEQDLLIKMVNEVSTMNLNVGNNQLIRNMLMLSDFEPHQFQHIINAKFNDDPRNIIMETHTKFDDVNCGINPFK